MAATANRSRGRLAREDDELRERRGFGMFPIVGIVDDVGGLFAFVT